MAPRSPAPLHFFSAFALVANTAAAATFVVNRTDDIAPRGLGSTCITAASTDCTIREAIIKANASAGVADTITFATSTNGTPITLTRAGDDDLASVGDLDVTDSLTITGNGSANTIIQAGTNATNGIDKVFALNPTCAVGLHFTITGVTVRFGRNTTPHDARFQDTGGGIDFCGSGTGGSSSSFTLQDSVVSSNSTLFGGAADQGHYGGGLNIDEVTPGTATVTITNTTFSNNTAASNGGGINIFGDGTKVTMTGVTISNNTTLATNGTGANGGGVNVRITNTPGGAFVTINGNSTISGNTATGPGGGICACGAGNQDVTIQDTAITGNTALNNGNFAAFGGGFYHDQTPGRTTTLTNVTISGNHANAFGSLGAVPRGGGIFVDSGLVTINGTSSITGNDTAGDGGGISVALTSASLSMTGGSITNNLAKNNGGGVYVGNSGAGAGGTVTLDHLSVTGNTANSDNTGGGDGGAIFRDVGTLNVHFGRIKGNAASTGGGGTGTTGVRTSGAGVADVTNTWWGCSTTPSAPPCDTVTAAVGSSVTFTPWIVLSHTASPNPILVTQPTTLTASFLKNSAGSVLTLGNISLLIGLPITFGNPVLGALSGAQATIQPSGTATATFTGGSTGGIGHADATVDAGTTTANITINQAPSVTMQPSGQMVCPGATASFSAAASGFPVPTVQWQQSTNGGVMWTDIGGATMIPLTFTTNSTQNGYQYRAVFSNGIGSPAMSNPATLNLDTTAPTVTPPSALTTTQTLCQ